MENLKAIILAIILVAFTYFYYFHSTLNVVAAVVYIVLAAYAFALFFAYFFGIKGVSYLIQNSKIYPNIFLAFVLPFLVVALLSWLIHAFNNIKPFPQSSDYYLILKDFIIKHVVFIVICIAVITVVTYFPAPKNHNNNVGLLRSNINFGLVICLLIALSIFAFYKANLISQLGLDSKFKSYNNLENGISSNQYEVNLLLSASPYNYADQPYLYREKDEVIIACKISSGNKDDGIETIYRIDKNGNIIDSAGRDDLETNDFYPAIIKGGLITDYNEKEFMTWIFNSSKERQSFNDIQKNKNWTLEEIKADNNALKMIHFYKTSAFHCNDIESVKYNGNRFYNLTLPKGILHIRMDSIYSHNDNIKNCTEKKLEYYSSDRLNFTLLRSDNNAYYIIKPKQH